MPARVEHTWSTIIAAAGKRWQGLDPLLPAPGPPPASCGAELIIGAAGSPAAAGACEHWAGEAGALEVNWGAERRFGLTAQVAGPDVADGLDGLLSLWRDHLAVAPGAGEEDSAAVITWPSRDFTGVKALRRHGLTPMTVIAVRTPRRPRDDATDDAAAPDDAAADGAAPDGAAPDDAAPDGAAPDDAAADGAAPDDAAADGAAAGRGRAAGGVAAGGTADQPAGGDGRAGGPLGDGLRIRRAGATDLDTVARLALEVFRFDAQFGGMTERPETAEGMRREAVSLLAGPEPWTWLAERDGRPVGLLAAQQPAESAWIAPMTGAAPASYLMFMVVLPGERGSGLGAAMVERYHREAAAAGVAVTLLHYEHANPLSAPFWSQQGYRPLWTTWEARPARALR